MNEEKFKKLHEEYKKLKAEISLNPPAQDSKRKSYEFVKSSSLLRFTELEKILRNECKDYLYLLSAGDRFDIQKNS